MKNGLPEILKKRLNGARRIAVLGIGSELRGDDIAGLLVARNIGPSPLSGNGVGVQAFAGGASPESLTGEIRRFNPAHIVIVDAADLGGVPGDTRIIETGDIDGISFSTHRLPTRILADYLIQSIGCDITVIGIQPESLGVCAAPSGTIVKCARETAAAILKAAGI